MHYMRNYKLPLFTLITKQVFSSLVTFNIFHLYNN